MIDIQTISVLNKEKFCQEVLKLVERDTTFFDAIMTVKERFNLHEKEVPKLLDVYVQANLHKEMLEMNLLRKTNDE